jgi:uncharacterized protein YukJ
MPIRDYGMLKGSLVYGVPYFSSYRANPHYVLVLDIGGGKQATIVVNSMSNDGTEVGIHTDFSFTDPDFVAPLKAAADGFPDTFPRVDYLRGLDLEDPSVWTPVPYEADADGGSKNDINDLLSSLGEVDTDAEPEVYAFFNGKTTQDRKAYKPSVPVKVVAFGQAFPAASQGGQTFPGGIHDAHMSQGEQEGTRFAKDNGIHQDGAIFFFVGDAVRAHFTVFSSQLVPTDSRGYPLPKARPLCPRIRER